MDPGYLTPIEVKCDNKAALSEVIRRASSDRRKRQTKTHLVLGEPRISKPQKRGVQRQPKVSDTTPKPAPPAIDFSPLTSNVSQTLDNPKTKPQILHRQPPPQIVKTKRFDTTNAKSVATSRRRAIRQKRSSDAQSRRLQPALVAITTYSGRISRPPVKWMSM